MKLLLYYDDNQFDRVVQYIDIRELSDDEITKKIVEIKKDANRPFVCSNVFGFKVIKVENALELIKLVGFDKAIKFCGNIETILQELPVNENKCKAHNKI